ncbi:ABC transporter permease [Bosea sp. BK604]|uniref:ABC transporter permease n=1 Tax=Bosea sp. BK604 TaxID=2512180 RepID=UPI00104E89BA|nr:ABC transporter permease [Bosea sp. BK604]TCR63161.1 peptide/nickel transport system permease protein [Bosea sp. BK604]
MSSVIARGPGDADASPSQSISVYGQAFRKLLRHKLGRSGLAVLVFMSLVAIAAPLLAPYDPTTVFYEDFLAAPSWRHWLGTDDVGRDVLSRIIYGAQVSFQVITVSVVGSVIVGSAVGMISGYVGGRLDHVLMRIVDGMLAFPMLVLALGVIAILGPGLTNAMIAITIVNIPGFARLVRGQVLSARNLDFVVAARALGASDVRIMVHHIWPKVAGNVIVYASLRGSAALITEASLAFLGLGVQPPTPSWGGMLTTSMQYWNAWWMSVFPGAAICIMVLALNFLGDGLRDALDARLSE